jgi:hypothetical protein
MEDEREKAGMGICYHRSCRQGGLALDAGTNFGGQQRHHARTALAAHEFLRKDCPVPALAASHHCG